MTTIAANRRSMAADTLVTHGEQKYYSTKIFVVGDSIVGGAGVSEHIARWMAWFRAGKPVDTEPIDLGENDSLDVLVLNRRGLFLYTNICDADPMRDPNYAIGSGSQAALLAMRRYRKHPTDAVKDACLVDNGTGGKVETLHLSNVPRSPAKD
jgi:ATP-dependent protease HslVU (ClpYQ) peptidase subunit